MRATTDEFGTTLSDYSAPATTTPTTTTTSQSQKLLEEAQALQAKIQSDLAAAQQAQVAIAAAQGATGNYSNMSSIMSNPAAYAAFKEARLNRITETRIANTPLRITPSSTGSTYSAGTDGGGIYDTSTQGGGGTSGGGTSYTPSSTPAVPAITTAAVVTTPPPPPVKTAPIDTILFNDDEVPIEIMTDLIFENIGGQELINIARNDTVNGQIVSYQPIKNLTTINQQYNPNNILSLQSTSDKYFQNFSIKLDNKIPKTGTGPNGAYVYIDPLTGDLIIEAVNLEIDEQIEVEIRVSGTIYEADI